MEILKNGVPKMINRTLLVYLLWVLFLFLGGNCMKNNYDVVVVGAGPAGVMVCYELIEKEPNLRVLLVDKGLNIYDRKCPILEKKISAAQLYVYK